MFRWVMVFLVFAHGWAHLVVWGLIPSLQPQSGSDPAHSWALGDSRPVANGLAVLTSATFAVAAIGLACPKLVDFFISRGVERRSG